MSSAVLERRSDGPGEVCGISRPREHEACPFFQLADRGPLDRLAGDRAFVDVVCLVLGIDRELEVETIVDVNMGEDARLLAETTLKLEPKSGQMQALVESLKNFKPNQ